MTLPLQIEIPYCASALALYAPVAGEPWSMLLDSGAQPAHPMARFDIVVAEPVTTLVTRGAITAIERYGALGEALTLDLAQGDPLALARRELARAGVGAGPTSLELPFAGGAVGYFSYDLARRFERRLPALAEDDRQWPEMALGIYRWAAITDHQARRSALVVAAAASMSDDELARLRALFGTPQPAPLDAVWSAPVRLSAMHSNLSEQAYRRSFERIARYIDQGDVYQVNLAQRFSAQFDGNAFALYAHLRERSTAPCGGCLELPFGSVLSVSPERFLRLRDGRIETRPIKGTRARQADPVADAAAAAELAASAKDRAENVMIVDLLRNDIGRCSRIGSVQVPQLCAVESFAQVHHLVSTVVGELAGDCDAFDLLRACFPGGSITGAPKLRAMQIIEELEPQRRGVYCGAIGYVGFDGAMDLNIAIRTATVRGQQVDYWAGGGIVADSQVELEYAESLAKAAVFLGLARPVAGSAD
jgi:para-aminobenzoate synthetase component I